MVYLLVISAHPAPRNERKGRLLRANLFSIGSSSGGGKCFFPEGWKRARAGVV